MGDNLSAVQAGLRLACPPSPASFDGDDLEEGGGGDGGSMSTVSSDGCTRNLDGCSRHEMGLCGDVCAPAV